MRTVKFTKDFQFVRLRRADGTPRSVRQFRAGDELELPDNIVRAARKEGAVAKAEPAPE